MRQLSTCLQGLIFRTSTMDRYQYRNARFVWFEMSNVRSFKLTVKLTIQNETQSKNDFHQTIVSWFGTSGNVSSQPYLTWDSGVKGQVAM